MVYYKELAAGRWQTLTFAQQMGNVGSDVERAIKWFRKKDDLSFQIAFEMALELFDLTLADPRWKDRRKEISRSREVFYTLLTEPESAGNLEKELDSLDEYFLQFGIQARLEREIKMEQK